MKYRIYLFVVFNMINSQIFSQIKINSYWVMSQNNVLIFGDSLNVQKNGNIGVSECNSSICDSSGNVLFYTDGLMVWNRFHQVVKNSEGISYQAGFNSSRQGVLLLSIDYKKVYLFNTAYQGKPGGLTYSIIDPKNNNDSGEVTIKRKQLVGYTNEAITAINHENNQDIWILAHDALTPNKFYKYLLTKDGLITCTDEQLVGPTNYSGMLDGQTNMKFSSDGKFLARTIGQFSVLELYEFNKSTGDLKFLNIIEPKGANNFISGFDFSANGRFLYYTRRDSSVTQYDIILKSKKTLKSLINLNIHQIQITPFNNILVAIPYKNYYSTIENIEGTIAYYKDSSIYLKGNESFVDVPNFNQSYFQTPSIEFKYDMNCVSNTIQFWGYDTFNATSHNWQIKKTGNPNEGNYATKNISHTFSDTGKYEVRYIASNGNRQDTVIKSITLHPKINKNFLGKDTSYAQGTSISKLLKVPAGMHCQLWQDSSRLSNFTADTAGVYICKVTNKSFCEVTDTIVITECINNLTPPSIYRSRDSLYTYQPAADSFVWFRNNVQYKITKEPFIRLTDTGTYRVEAAKKDHCNRSSITNHVNKLGINYFLSIDFNIQLFPNPSSEQVFIKADKNFVLQVFDITGRIITVQENIESINLPKGVYFFNFIVDGYRFTEKVIIL